MKAVAFFLIFIPLMSHSAEVLECISRGKIKYYSGGKELLEFSAYCYNKEKTSIIDSRCLKAKCLAYQIKKVNREKLFNSPYGTPEFSVCREMGGRPQFIDFLVGKNWYELDRCLFSDGTYVDTGTLLGRQLGN